MKKLLLALAIVGFAVVTNANEKSEVLIKAESGNLKALNEAFVLQTKTDGGDAEDIDIAIGESIRNNSKNFLTALKKNRSSVARLDSSLGNLGPDFVDDLKKQKVELEERLKAIRSVKNGGLKDVRTECESELKRQIEKRSGN